MINSHHHSNQSPFLIAQIPISNLQKNAENCFQDVMYIYIYIYNYIWLYMYVYVCIYVCIYIYMINSWYTHQEYLPIYLANMSMFPTESGVGIIPQDFSKALGLSILPHHRGASLPRIAGDGTKAATLHHLRVGLSQWGTQHEWSRPGTQGW